MLFLQDYAIFIRRCAENVRLANQRCKDTRYKHGVSSLHDGVSGAILQNAWGRDIQAYASPFRHGDRWGPLLYIKHLAQLVGCDQLVLTGLRLSQKRNLANMALKYNFFGRGKTLRAAIMFSCQMAFILFGMSALPVPIGLGCRRSARLMQHRL